MTSIVRPKPITPVPKMPLKDSFVFNSDENNNNNNNNNNIFPDINLSQTKIQIPVSFETDTSKSTKLQNYEIPVLKNSKNNDLNFVEKLAKKITTKNRLDMMPLEAISQDIKNISSMKFNSEDNISKHNKIYEERESLIKDSIDLKTSVIADISNLLKAKVIAVRINNLVENYEKKLIDMQEDKRLKLSDEMDLKKMLKEKLKAEVQGIRTTDSQFKDLEKLNPDDVKKVTDQVISSLKIE